MATRRASLDGTITWSNGDLFDGYGMIVLQAPLDAQGVQWPALSATDKRVRQQLPPYFPIPIKAGKWNDRARLVYNADIDPPNTAYAVWYYDSNRKLCGSPSGSSDFFQVATDNVTPPTYTLTVPTTATVINTSPES